MMMRSTLAAIALLACVVSVSATTEFGAFKAKFGKAYATPAEEAHRLAIFTTNMKTAAKMMAANPLATFGANSFADMSAEEFKVMHNSAQLYKQKVAERAELETVQISAAEVKVAAGGAIDWRAKGAVTPVKNQGQCGSCWSFSTTGGIEGQWFLAGNKLTSLSEQEFVSCDTIDHGCQGGLMDNAYNWVLKNRNGTLVTEASYPYVSGGGQVPPCTTSGHKFGAQIDGFKNIDKNEDKMAAFVLASGPLSIAVDATTWQTYTGGIMTNCPAAQIDHGVLIVGFDDNNSPPYWIIKNSWAAGWGEQGYLRVEKGTDQCSITSYPCSATVKKGPHPAPTNAPSGPTPPGPSGADFVQKTCTDDECKNCTVMSLAQNKCVTAAKGSYKARCITDGLLIMAFTSRDCTGASTTTSNPINVCSVVFRKGGMERFVMNDCAAKPPTPNGPTSAPSAAPTAAPTSGNTFTQKNCQDAACTTGCSSHTFPQNKCLKLNGGGSAKAVCKPKTLLMTEYPISADCTGISIPNEQAINTCLKDNQGTYFENVCNSGASAVADVTALVQMTARTASEARLLNLKLKQ